MVQIADRHGRAAPRKYAKVLGPAAQDNAKKEKQNGAERSASSIFKWQQSHPGRFASFERVVEAYKAQQQAAEAEAAKAARNGERSANA